MKRIISFFAMAAMLSTALVSCNKDNGTPGTGNEGGELPGITLPASLSGSEYIVVQLGAEELEAIKSKVTVNMMPYTTDSDKDGIALYVWEGTYAGGTCSGLNSYGFTDEWVNLYVTSVGWSGAAYNLTADGLVDRASDWAKFKAIAGNESDWYFHFAYKSEQVSSHVGQIHWAGGDYNFVFGDPAGTFTDGNEIRLTPVSGEYKTGEWNEYEVCLADTPINFAADATSENFFTFLSGGVTGTTLDMDAIFFYKK